MNQLIDNSHIFVMVSHDLGIIRSMCNRVLWLDSGRVVADGQPNDVCQAYLRGCLPAVPAT